MKLEKYINYDYLFISMCLTIAIRYFIAKDTKFVIEYS